MGGSRSDASNPYSGFLLNFFGFLEIVLVFMKTKTLLVSLTGACLCFYCERQ